MTVTTPMRRGNKGQKNGEDASVPSLVFRRANSKESNSSWSVHKVNRERKAAADWAKDDQGIDDDAIVISDGEEEARNELSAQAQLDGTNDVKPDTKPDIKPGTNADIKPDLKPDLKPDIKDVAEKMELDNDELPDIVAKKDKVKGEVKDEITGEGTSSKIEDEMFELMITEATSMNIEGLDEDDDKDDDDLTRRTTRSRTQTSRFNMDMPDPKQKRNASTDSKEPEKPKVQTRELFGEDEDIYIMDAKSMGNLGRYLNHSCGPNVFVQNVFVDTHDLRFPWIAFFALSYIRAGTELTWDYNYEVGSVPDKTLLCYCGAPECRGRLL